MEFNIDNEVRDHALVMAFIVHALHKTTPIDTSS